MSRKQDDKVKKRLQYDRANLKNAYEATLKGMTVYRAAREYRVPERTLRDRTLGNVSLDVDVGHKLLFTPDQEHALVEHIKYMAKIGYGYMYNRSGIQFMARDFAASFNLPVPEGELLSNKWFYAFLKRWPDLKVVQPQKLSLVRAKSASKGVIDAYFNELESVLEDNDLVTHPERIFNIDETGISSEHNPTKIVCDKSGVAQAVTSPRTRNVTIIAGGSAIGQAIPPYYVFPGTRWDSDLLKGAACGAAGECTKTGWSNSTVFINYLTKHFARYAGLQRNSDTDKTLILYDGHKSHVSLTLSTWAAEHSVILFVLPPHSSHLTQPLDVSVFGPMKAIYYRQCQSYMHANPGISITRNSIAALTKKPYMKAVTAENLESGFRKTGIYPLNKSAISEDCLAPAVIYEEQGQTHDEEPPVTSAPATATVNEQQEEAVDPEATTATSAHTTVINEQQETPNHEATDSGTTATNQQQVPATQDSVPGTIDVETTASSSQAALAAGNTNSSNSVSFFDKYTITAVVKKPKRKFVPPFLCGNLQKPTNIETLSSVAAKKCKPVAAKKLQKGKSTSVRAPRPSTSGLNQGGGPLNLSEDSESDPPLSQDEDDLCCVCGKFEPDFVRQCTSVVFTKWAQCDVCGHWVHLIYCTSVRVVRRGSEFRCPHCPADNLC